MSFYHITASAYKSAEYKSFRMHAVVLYASSKQDLHDVSEVGEGLPANCRESLHKFLITMQFNRRSCKRAAICVTTHSVCSVSSNAKIWIVSVNLNP